AVVPDCGGTRPRNRAVTSARSGAARPRRERTMRNQGVTIQRGPFVSLLVIVAALLLVSIPTAAQEHIPIGIGHHSLWTDTYSGGIPVKQLGLLDKHLPRAGKYAGAKYDIVWEDYTSGPPITNQMLAGKLDIGVMGDYPLLVNIARFQEMQSLRSIIV